MEPLWKWRNKVQEVWTTDTVHGIVRLGCLLVLVLQFLSLSNLIIPDRFSDRVKMNCIEVYVIVKSVLLFVLVLVPNCVTKWLAIYLVAEMLLYRFQRILFVDLGPGFGLPLGPLPRSLLLLILNLAEVTFAFALFYRLTLSNWGPWEAIINSALVVGTVDHPKVVPADIQMTLNELVAIQIALNFLLIAIFLSNIMARRGSEKKTTGHQQGHSGEPIR